jgi:hypothetical protein
MPLELEMLLLWTAMTVASLASTVWWLVRFWRHPARWSVICTGAAAAPNAAMLVEAGIRSISELSRSLGPGPLDYPTTMLAVAWLLPGPLLLIVGIVMRVVTEEAPRWTGIVQGGHALSWAWSSLVVFLYLALTI